MHLESKRLVFSPSDLTQYMESPFVSWMEHLAVCFPAHTPSPDQKDELIDVLQELGNQHEQELLAAFKEQGLSVVNLRHHINPHEATRAAMEQGAEVIYQACLQLQPFRGYADFLIKVNGKSDLGSYHYEVWDTKLAKSVKAHFLIQLCCYTEMLAAIQGVRPEFMTVILGNQEKKRYRTQSYFYFYENLKQHFIAAHQKFDPKACPDPAASRSWGRWESHAKDLLAAADHLAQVATITFGQIKKLNQAGVHTLTDLIHKDLRSIKGIKPEILERLKIQAQVQKESLGKASPVYHLIPNQQENKQGLALLPPASAHDVFFDIEGFPLEEGGLEYLWGVTYFDEQGERQYKDFWAHTPEQEKEAFRLFIEWVYQRWERDPSLRIYHYASYEITACRKLMGRYGICEYEVDQLLRNEVFVDLYKIVKGALVIGEPRYSIKNVEHLYRGKRDTEVTSGGDSVVVYERWRESPDGDSWENSAILKGIRLYNIDDCNSTQELAYWLRGLQQELGVFFVGKTEKIEPEVKEIFTEVIQLRDRLLAQAESLKQGRQYDVAKLHHILAWSLEFHRRELKPVFWRMFDRMGLTADELLDDIDCLAFCQRTAKEPFKPSPRAQNLVYEYAFDPNQEFKAHAKSYYILGEKTDEGKDVTASFYEEGSDLEGGLIALQMKKELPSTLTLIPNEWVNPAPIPLAINQQVAAFEQGLLENTAIIDFLSKSLPRIHGHPTGQAIAPSHDPKQRLEQIIHAVSRLNNSYLTIQGPPGAGKTYTGKHVIAELLKQGKKIGISSNSHKAINNLLISTASYCQKEGIKGYFACASNTDPKLIEHLNITVLENKDIVNSLTDGCVIGTTAWGFSRAELHQAFDYLFIDEAGQVSVANLIAMSQAAKNLILMGDQMQLGQPSQGSHPEESGLSILDYLLHAAPTIPDSMGVFLGTTYRMHSAVNCFISEAIYEGKLESAPENDRQIVEIPEYNWGILAKEAGIIPIPVPHQGNTQASDEEVECIISLAHELLGRIFHTKEGTQRPIGWDDILFVAPYNHQVNKLKMALGPQVKVGSVDKFQGQEAPIVFLSMCASSANESPRGLSFLFDKNRLNVAISRAQSLAIVVYSPALLDSVPNHVEHMEMMNIFCQLVHENGDGQVAMR